MAIFFNLPPTANHLHPLQVENSDSNSRLVVDEDDNGKLRPERVNRQIIQLTFLLTDAIHSDRYYLKTVISVKAIPKNYINEMNRALGHLCAHIG